MTPQPKSAYRLICERECKWCAKGVPFLGNAHDCHYPSALQPCTAPSRDTVIERQAKEIEELRKTLILAHAALLEGAQAMLEYLKHPGRMNGLNVHCRRAHEAMQAAMKEEPNAR